MSLHREPMSGVDTAWLHMDRPDNLMSIMGVLRFKRRLTLRAVRRLVADRFLVHPLFRMRPVEGTIGAYWEQAEEFDLEQHVREIRLRSDASDDALPAMLGRLAGTPFDRRRPLWEFVLVVHPVRGCSLVMRVHHCYADGIALVRVVLSLADPEPGTHEAGTGGGGDRAPEEGLGQWLEKGLQWALHPERAAAAARTGFAVASELAHVALMPDDPATALRGKLTGAKRIAWADALPLASVRTVAKRLDCTINDVLTATVAAALRAWLRARGQQVQGLSLRAAVPVNLRDAAHPATLGNEFGLVFVTLPIGIADPIERVRTVHEEMLALRKSWQPAMALGLLSALGLGPRAVQAPAIYLISRKATLVMSNVPGPRAVLKFCGAPMVGTMFWVPQSGDVGLGVSVLTYAGQVQFGLMTDSGIMAEPAQLVRRFRTEFRRLERAVG
jgi:WS/DGAT/MGAT family acyltransferase